MTKTKKKLTKEQQRLLNKQRLKNKITLLTQHRASYITVLHTHIKDFYGMLKHHINNFETQFKNNMPEKVATCIRMIKNAHINVFRRAISKIEFTELNIMQKLQEIHKYLQSLINKNILINNEVTNIMQKLNYVYNTIFMNKVYNSEQEK